MYKELLNKTTSKYTLIVEILNAINFYNIKDCMKSFAIQVNNIKRTQQFVIFRSDEIKVMLLICLISTFALDNSNLRLLVELYSASVMMLS